MLQTVSQTVSHPFFPSRNPLLSNQLAITAKDAAGPWQAKAKYLAALDKSVRAPGTPAKGSWMQL